MKGLFDKIGTKTCCSTMSKSDKKKYNVAMGNVLDMKTEYKMVQITGKLKLIRDSEKFLFFEYYNRIYPTIQNFDKSLFKTVVLDEGAVGPLSRGADVMAPGVIKYQNQSVHFKKDDVVGIEILNQGIFAIGLCLIDFEEMLLKKEGPVIEVYHIKNDMLDQNLI
ncbi:uncharacterized protein VICG_00607 [Vittaforma corneae ATCC 50505]|uniref:PUA domain-containing protein n=1 Tax=Vittaforma corneae (strain ATCC 50505) TaxID=993615 RepID=L2GNN6_VITCO|nr:uncharacterized protein VICG_00607 [Vittaforma corneae ATCC 50505]ELA42508.1 hypothetical protein VICG_00607 [Vittaforma corneae ATCC 50505]